MKECIVFLDRDGVINEDSDAYIKHPSEFVFIPQSPEAIALLNQKGFSIIVITNQSIIGRKMASQNTLDAIFNKMTAGVNAAGGQIHDVFFCPHTVDDGCDCRKPAPGLILAAQKKYDLDLSQTCMVGDRSTDIECARNAGCGKAVLVQTGNGRMAAHELSQKGIIPDYTAVDLYDAAQWIIRNMSR